MTTVPTVLSIALGETSDPVLRPLPEEVAALLAEIGAPPRLVAHLRAVHDVAARLLDRFGRRDPAPPVDRWAVLFGAATHDIGKTLYPDELSGPGSRHEEAGRDLLLAHGVSPGLARFAATHASWGIPDAGLEDLLVSLADKVWKNKRVADLEDLVVAELSRVSGRPVWQEFLDLDEFLTALGEEADLRLAWQAAHPVHG
ncbi:HD domain-containing protein [Streptomyces sp. IBSBF 2953]|uniref:HD domain-containing protein n=1 Tax=Streptomyces TaxID=1883 RepID=UPI002119C5BF|nr:HD domain-containing protein [Streptomyces scabiei]MCQ9184437.1 HD domain-containing protein [Streptomyces hayashii]MDX3112042.1 HD domain-containing protein [Streptomyces scabiei]